MLTFTLAILAVISLFGVIRGVERINTFRRRDKETKQKIKEFEEEHPPGKEKNGNS